MNFKTTIFNLDYDVLKTILLLVVASAGGVTDLAKTMHVCRTFSTFGEDKDLLKMANFENFVFPKTIEHCQHIRSLLIRCAEAGNAGAQYILAQVILLRFSQLVDRDTLPPFLCYFMPGQAMSSNLHGNKFTHFELVSLFLSRCSILDHASMLPHVQNYVDHFRIGTKAYTKFYQYFNYLTSILRTIVDTGRVRKTLYSHSLYNDCPIQPDMRNVWFVLYKLEGYGTLYSLTSGRKLSQSEWKELKSKCHFIVNNLLSFESHAKPLEEDVKILDMGKRVFYYLAFSGTITQEIGLVLNRDEDKLWTACMHYAKKYNAWQHKSASALYEMFV